MPREKEIPLPLRAAILTLKSSVCSQSSAAIQVATGVSIPSINRIYATAIKRGFEPNVVPLVILDEYIVDKPRSGRPSKQTEANRALVISKVTVDRYGREKTLADIAGDLSNLGISISASTIRKILKNAGFRKTKPTRKPGLTKRMKKERLEWCLAHKDWSLEDWKNVIWSDETSVLLNHRRGGYRVWRRADEAIVKSCIRERWKGFQEFMFWGCFSYDRKGPCHCWVPETAQEKKDAEKEIEEWNSELEPVLREEWELNTNMARMGLRGKRGRKPTWNFTAKNGKLVRVSKGGIDWYRYQKEILHPKLFPFAKECEKSRPDTIVQEDKAPSHNHAFQAHFYDLAHVKKMLWPGNSPDLNAIEPTWFWMKRHTTKKGPPKNRSEAIRKWEKTWEELDQARIREWIERIPHHVQQIIALEGGNEYKEGRPREFGPKKARGRPRKPLVEENNEDLA
jgi:hypothetical protein